ncbi:MAG: RDD family protein [Pseudorhodoplanes sp.]
MADNNERIGVSYDVKPHAYDPDRNPELFDGIPARRVVAFVIDLTILAIPLLLLWIFFFAIGIVTFGAGFVLFGLMPAISVVWALFYYGATLGSPQSATLGMRAMDIEMRTWYGAPAYFVLGAVHAVVFWVTVSALTPFILLVCFFNGRKRLLHDFLVGTVVVNNSARAGALRPTDKV